MGQKISYDAHDPKRGMSLAELETAVNNAAGLAQVNEKNLDDSKVSIMINWSGGIKQLTVEV